MTEFQAYTAKTATEAEKAYADWAKNYEADIQDVYGAFVELAMFMDIHLHDKDAQILDIGAGTGLLGVELTKYGFKNMDAHDGSEEMLELARQKNVYHNFYLELLHPGQPNEKLPKGHYDVVAGSGIIAPGHLNSDHLESMIEPIKKGGKFFLAVRELWLVYDDLKSVHPEWKYDIEKAMKKMEENGSWKLLIRKKIPNYVKNTPGVLFVYEKL